MISVSYEIPPRKAPALVQSRSGGSSTGTGSTARETAHAAEQARPDVVVQRRRGRQEQRQLTPELLVFLE